MTGDEPTIDFPVRLRIIARLMGYVHFSAKSIGVVLSAADEIERLTAEIDRRQPPPSWIRRGAIGSDDPFQPRAEAQGQ